MFHLAWGHLGLRYPPADALNTAWPPKPQLQRRETRPAHPRAIQAMGQTAPTHTG